jgi:hypothetical protein
MCRGLSRQALPGRCQQQLQQQVAKVVYADLAQACNQQLGATTQST